MYTLYIHTLFIVLVYIVYLGTCISCTTNLVSDLRTDHAGLHQKYLVHDFHYSCAFPSTILFYSLTNHQPSNK